MANIGSLIAHLGVDTSGLRSAAQDFKQFETTTSSGLSSMTKGVAALAAAFASLKLAQGGKDSVMFAASVEQADVALRSIANSMGVSADKAVKYRDSLRDVNITTLSATNATSQFIRMGLPIEKLNQLGTAAQGAAINYKTMTGETISSSEALSKMVHAIATGQSMILHNLGIMTNMRDVMRENRQETGESSQAIDSHKRHLLVLNDVLEKTVPMMNLYRDSTGLATKNISSSKRPLEEMKLALGNLFLPELTAASLAFYNTVSSGQKWIRSHGDELRTATGMIKDFSEGMLYAAGVLGIYATAMGAASLANGSFAATTGLFTGLLATLRMQLSLTGAAATVAGTASGVLGGEFWTVAVSSKVATLGVLSLKAAMGVLSGFMIGWEIGKWWSTFESGAKAGVAVVHALVKAWDWVSEAAERAWVAMKGSATTWTGVMGALDAIGKKYDALAAQRSAAFGGSWDAAKGKPVAGPAAKEWKEDPAVVAANAARIAAEQAEAAALAGAQAAKKLAEQWAKTRRGLEQELKLEGLTGLEKTLQEITNRADELRATAGTDKAWVKQWEEQTKAAATYRDEIERLGKQYEVFAENQLELKRIKEDYDALVIDMLPAEARAVALVTEEYKKKRQIIEDAMASGKASAEDGATQMAIAAQREAEANTKAIDAIRDKSDTTKKIWENMYTNLQSITADWLENMKISWSSLGTLFKKFVAQMVSAWAWGQASMAFAGDTTTAAGSAGKGLTMGAGLAALGGAAALGATVAGPKDFSTALTTAGIGLAGVGFEAYNGTVGATAAMLQTKIADLAAQHVSESLGTAIYGLSSAAFAGWASGIGTFVVGLIRGQSFKDAAIQGAGAGFGAWGGAELGFALGGPVGAAIGAILGSVAGSWLGSLFGSGSKENTFTLTELVPSMATSFDKKIGMIPTGWQHGPGGNQWYAPIANAYSDIVGVVQTSFNEQVFDFAKKLPATLQDMFLAEMERTDFRAIIAEASGGRWGVSGASGALETVAKNLADGLSQGATKAYLSAFANFLETSSPAELLSTELASVWNTLTDSAQATVKGLYRGAATAMRANGFEAGATEMEKVSTALSQIAQAMAPIQEIIDTNGLTEYELSIRAINKEFDDYASALTAAGVDLSKYTQLEEARAISLAKAAAETSRLTQAMKDYVDSARAGLQTATDAEKSRLADRQAVLQDNLQTAEGLLRRSFAAEIEKIGKATQATIDGLNTKLQASQKTISTLGQAVSKLTSAADSMTGTGSRAGILSAISGLQGIAQSVRGGNVGALSDVDKYLSIVTGDNAQYYASFDEYQRDFLKAKIAILDLNAVAGDTLNTEEQMAQMLQTQIDLAQSSADQQISALNSQLDALLGVDTSVADLKMAIAEYSAAQAEIDAFGYDAQITLLDSQLDELMGINTGVLSLADAIREYAGAVVAAMGAGAAPDNWKPVIAEVTKGMTEQWVKTAGGDVWQSNAGAAAVSSGAATGANAMIYTPDGRQFTVGTAIDFVNQSLAAGDALAVYNQAKDAGISLSSLETMMGWSPGLASGWAADNGLESFAKGTDFLPSDGPVFAHRGERITPAAYNRSDATNAEIVAELRMLRRDNEAMKTELQEIKRSNKRIMDITEKSDAIGPAPARATV